MKKIRVIHFHRPPGDGHSIERVFDFVRSGFSEEIDVRVCCLPYKSLNLKNIIRNGMWARREAKAADIVHVTGDVHYLSLFIPKNNSILTVHDLGHLQNLKKIKKLVYFLIWFWLPVRLTERITVISQFTKRSLINATKCKPHKVSIVPDPIPPAYHQQQKDFNSGEPACLFVGTGANKNLARVAEALQGIKCSLRIIGHLSAAQIKLLSSSKINYSNDFDITDAQMLADYKSCDLVIFPSTHEGFGMPIIEAQALGRPVVTSNIPPMCDVAGEGAALVAPFSTDSIRKGVERVIHDKPYREEIIKKGLRNVEKYTPSKIAFRYETIYKELMDLK